MLWHRRPVSYTRPRIDRAGVPAGFEATALSDGSTPLIDATDRDGRPLLVVVRGAAAAAAGLLLLVPSTLPGQQIAPAAEDGELPPPGEVRLRAGPVLQAWHREFGPGPGEGRTVPLAEDWSGPVLEQFSPGPEAILGPINGDAEALGFEPLGPSDASLGSLEMRELSAEIRALALRMEVGLLEGLAADAAVPLVWTEVEPFGSFDPSGATFASATRLFETPGIFFGDVAAARNELLSLLNDGDITGDEADQARDLLDRSGAFADVLERRVQNEALVPLPGTAAGDQLLAHYQGLREGFTSFGLSLPTLSLPDEAGPALLGSLPADPLAPVQRGWLAGEAEFGLRYRIHDGFGPDTAATGLEARTVVGGRVRLPFRPGNSTPFVQPSDLLGVPLGDGQRDLEAALYQDLRWGGWLRLGAVVRYGLQQADEVTVRPRSPDRPFAVPDAARRVERDLGDYVRVRLAPRVVVNRFLSVGAEYRYWRKGSDRYRVLEGEGDASLLELQTEQTRHRGGLGAFYRPDPPEEGADGGAPELGLVWQTALSGSGGEVPVANLVNFHLRIPVRVF